MSRTLFFVLMAVLLSSGAGAQALPAIDAGNTNINIVILVLATIFAGIIAFLVYLERKLARLEKRQKAQLP